MAYIRDGAMNGCEHVPQSFVTALGDRLGRVDNDQRSAIGVGVEDCEIAVGKLRVCQAVAEGVERGDIVGEEVFVVDVEAFCKIIWLAVLM